MAAKKTEELTMPENPVTDVGQALIQLAEANNLLVARRREAKALEEKIEAASSELEKTSANLEGLRKESVELHEKNEAFRKANADKTDAVLQAAEAKLAEANDTALRVIEESDALAARASEVDAKAADIELTFAKANAKSDNAESKALEAQRLKIEYVRAKESSENERKALEIESNRLELLKKEIEEKQAKVTEDIAKLEQFQKECSSENDRLRKLRDESDVARERASREISAADFLKNEGRTLITIIRQDLHRYVQLSGVEVKIAELTDAHRKIAAEALLEGTGLQVVNPETVTEPEESTEESETVTE